MEFDIKPNIGGVNSSECVGNYSSDGGNGHSINLYKTPPFGTLTLEECQDLFRQRIEALTIMERAAEMAENRALTGDIISSSMRDIKSYVYKTNCISLRSNDMQQRKQDHFSHMLARMYCIYNTSLWDWFRSCEKKLLHYRLRDKADSISGAQLELILKSFNFDFKRVVGSELSELYRENLIGWKDRRYNEIADIFRVKFVDALKFIAKRSVSLKDGFAFLTRNEIITVVCDVFEKHLNRELMYARQHLNTDLLQTQQLLDSLSMVYLEHQEKLEEERIQSKRSQDSENRSPYSIDLDNLTDIIKKHYPPCMRYMHEALTDDHHLRHQARVYYGAFLRSGGVDMESAIEFWRKEFTKKIDNAKFERDYKYNIRHLYGREGHKKALSCFSCDKIINENPPGPADKHGCPFKHFDDSHLRTMLTKHGLKEVDIESIFLQTSQKEYRLACSKYFEFTKGELPTEPIKNPVHFYYESMRLANRPIEHEAETNSENANETKTEQVADIEPKVDDDSEMMSED